MKLLTGEREILKHGTLSLTNLRLIKRVKFLGGYELQEIPLRKIDSISVKKHFSIIMIIMGGLFLLASYLYPSINGINSSPYLISIAVLIFILAFISEKEVVCFSSKTISIIEEKKGSDNFIEEVRKKIYN